MGGLCTVSANTPAKMSPARGGGLPLSRSHCPSSPRNSSCHLVSTHSVLAGSKKRTCGQGEFGGKGWSPECGRDCGHWSISEPGREAGRLPEKRALHSDSLGEQRYQCLQRDPGNGVPEASPKGICSPRWGHGAGPSLSGGPTSGRCKTHGVRDETGSWSQEHLAHAEREPHAEPP